MTPADLPSTFSLGSSLGSSLGGSIGFPIGLTVLLLATAGVGTLLLVAGNRLLVASLGLIGGAFGAAVGWATMEVFVPGAPAWVGAVALGVLAAILLALSSRLVMAVAMAAILGAAGWLTVSSADRHGWIDLGGTPSALVATSNAAPPATTAPADANPDANPDGEPDASPDGDQTLREAVEAQLAALTASFRTATLERHLGATIATIDGGVQQARTQWTGTPSALRTLMLASAGMCAFLGLCLGLVAPKFTASGITAAIGATLLLACAAVLVRQFIDDTAPLPGAPTAWFAGWAILTLGGATVQTMRKPRPAAKPAEG